jgi:hypothetical protein
MKKVDEKNVKKENDMWGLYLKTVVTRVKKATTSIIALKSDGKRPWRTSLYIERLQHLKRDYRMNNI